MPMYWFSNQFSLTGWNTASALIATGLVSANMIIDGLVWDAYSVTDLAAILCILHSWLTSRSHCCGAHGQTWRYVSHWIVSCSPSRHGYG